MENNRLHTTMTLASVRAASSVVIVVPARLTFEVIGQLACVAEPTTAAEGLESVQGNLYLAEKRKKKPEIQGQGGGAS